MSTDQIRQDLKLAAGSIDAVGDGYVVVGWNAPAGDAAQSIVMAARARPREWYRIRNLRIRRPDAGPRDYTRDLPLRQVRRPRA